MKKAKTRITAGDIRDSKHCGLFEILDKIGRSVTVKFLLTGFQCTTDVTNVVTGGVRDLYHPSRCGVGFVGKGDFLPTLNKRAYRVWSNLLTRCYTEWELGQVNYTYNLCTVDSKWHNFQNFAAWYTAQPHHQTFELDKDLLAYGNKLYSEDFCCLLPHDINTALQDKDRNSIKGFPGVHFKKSNNNYVAQMSTKEKISKHIGSYNTPEEARAAYLRAKEQYLKFLAEKYKTDLDSRAYVALINWKPS